MFKTREEARENPLQFTTDLLDNFPILTWQDEFGWHAMDFSSIRWVAWLPDSILWYFEDLSKHKFRMFIRLLSIVVSFAKESDFAERVASENGGSAEVKDK